MVKELPGGFWEINMQISNADKVSEEVQKYKEEVELKLKSMVAMFAFETAQAISRNTPIGSASSLEAGELANGKGPFAAYLELYVKRNERWNIPVEVGYHRGALQYSESGDFPFTPDINSDYDASNSIYDDASSQYKIGDTFYIGAQGPAYDFLEDGKSEQAPQGITIPALAEVYSIDLPSIYNS